MSQASTDEQIEDLRSRALAELESAPDLKTLDEWRVAFMGRRGELTQLLRGLGSLPAEERPVRSGPPPTRSDRRFSRRCRSVRPRSSEPRKWATRST